MTAGAFGNTHPSAYNGYRFACKYRFIEYVAGLTSRISIKRKFAHLLSRLPDPSIRTSAYDLVLKGGTVIADIYSLNEMLSSYGLHGDNAWYASSRIQSRDFLERVDAYLSQKLAESGLFSGASLYDSMACCTELVVDRKWLT
jgi:hypothetical protein